MSAFEISGQEQLGWLARELGDRFKDPRLKTLIGTLGARECQRNIDNQSSPDGEKYAPTRRGGTILRDRGTLYNGITFEVDAAGVIIGAGATTSAYNAYQQFGSRQWNEGATWSKGRKKGQRKGNPARPFIGLSEAAVDLIAEEVADFITRLDD